MDKAFIIIVVILDFLLGDPEGMPHPVCGIGKVITTYETLLRRLKWLPLELGGFILAGSTIFTIWTIISLLLKAAALIHPWVHRILVIYFLYTALAAKCLKVEAMKVYQALGEDDLEEARRYLSYIVGRDTQTLDGQGIIRGAVETVAENTIDGVIAPILYMGLGMALGIPVQMTYLYKTINTLDSMVGYMHEPYREIGYASAKLDDIANFIPARSGSLIMLLAGGLVGLDVKSGYRILKRDRRNHKSPNSGHPESVVAGLLNIELGGSSIYFGHVVQKPTMGDGKRSLEDEDILRTIRITYISQVIAALLVL